VSAVAITPGIDWTAPVLDWQAAMQPVPLHRASVVFARLSTMTYLVDADKIYREELQVRWNAAGLRHPIEVPLHVAMEFAGNSKGNRNRPDLTNLEKAVEDAGNGILWRDDVLIHELFGRITWGPNVKPLVRVRAWLLDPDATPPSARKRGRRL
jgi:Holliday junction resolvase RusA-like endonuclease